jgi:putative endonuclease
VTIARQRTGRRAEDLVAARLTGEGWLILERNARTRFGEIDIVAADGRCLVFVEVKAARAGHGPFCERPELAVGRQKQRRLRRLAGAWLARCRAQRRWEQVRFDVVAVSFGERGEVLRFEHILDAF